MTLQDRIARAEGRTCRTQGCERAAQRDALFCPDCLTTVWLTGREPEWIQRMRAGQLRGKDYTKDAA
jgi:hypothetical protein